MKTNSEEPLTAIILKAFSILSACVGVYYFAKCLLSDPPGKELAQITATTLDYSRNFAEAVVGWMSAISLWWMASVLSLLDRIAKNGESQLAPAAARITDRPKAQGNSLKVKLEEDAGGVPKYEL